MTAKPRLGVGPRAFLASSVQCFWLEIASPKSPDQSRRQIVNNCGISKKGPKNVEGRRERIFCYVSPGVTEVMFNANGQAVFLTGSSFIISCSIFDTP